MTVPALTTAEIATFTYWRQPSCTYVQLADVLPILHSYQQFGEYVDGTIKIFDTGSESPAPDNYVLVNVRIRADGWIMAWFPRTLMTGTADSGSGVVVTDTVMQITRNGATSAGSVAANELAGYIFKPTSGPLSGNEYTIKSNTTTAITLHVEYGDDEDTNVATLGGATYDILQSRGNLVWWGHTSNAIGNPTAQSTRLGRALYEMWETLKTNQQGGSGAALSYGDVGYWDYEYTSATHLYIFGKVHDVLIDAQTKTEYYYATIPVGVAAYSAVLNFGGHNATGSSNFYFEGYVETIKRYHYTSKSYTSGFMNRDMTSVFASNYGVRKTMTIKTFGQPSFAGSQNIQAIILLTSG